MKKEATLAINPIRLNWHYVIWYKNFTVILVSLVVPFILLAYWNLNTLSVMLRRRRLRNRPALNSNNSDRDPSDSPVAANREMAAAFLNVSNLAANITACSTSRQGNEILIFYSILILVVYFYRYRRACGPIKFIFNFS